MTPVVALRSGSSGLVCCLVSASETRFPNQGQTRISAGRFHIWTTATVDEAPRLMTARDPGATANER